MKYNPLRRVKSLAFDCGFADGLKGRNNAESIKKEYSNEYGIGRKLGQEENTRRIFRMAKAALG